MDDAAEITESIGRAGALYRDAESVPTRPTHVETQLDDLGSNVENLVTLIAMLEKRLDPILRSEVDADVAGYSDEALVRTAETLRNRNETLRSCTMRLRSILDRCEL